MLILERFQLVKVSKFRSSLWICNTKLDELNTWTYHSALMFITMWIVHGGLPRGVVVVGAWVCERGGNSFSSSIHL